VPIISRTRHPRADPCLAGLARYVASPAGDALTWDRAMRYLLELLSAVRYREDGFPLGLAYLINDVPRDDWPSTFAEIVSAIVEGRGMPERDFNALVAQLDGLQVAMFMITEAEAPAQKEGSRDTGDMSNESDTTKGPAMRRLWITSIACTCAFRNPPGNTAQVARRMKAVLESSMKTAAYCIEEAIYAIVDAIYKERVSCPWVVIPSN
jgi:hypothetical protein